MAKTDSQNNPSNTLSIVCIHKALSQKKQHTLTQPTVYLKPLLISVIMFTKCITLCSSNVNIMLDHSRGIEILLILAPCQCDSVLVALLRVFNDLLMQGDAGEWSVLVLLDLTAAFDTVDHCILAKRLSQYVGISGKALKWFSSYLSHMSFSVRIQNYASLAAPLSSGVPQGSVLAPLLFALLPLGELISTFQGICIAIQMIFNSIFLLRPMKLWNDLFF